VLASKFVAVFSEPKRKIFRTITTFEVFAEVFAKIGILFMQKFHKIFVKTKFCEI
jgi:hypothetical protein